MKRLLSPAPWNCTVFMFQAKENYHTRCLEYEKFKRESASQKDLEKVKLKITMGALYISASEPETVEPVLKDHLTGYKNVVCQDRWSLVTGSVILKGRSFCRKSVVCQDRWSVMEVVSQDRFHCIASLS